MLIQAIEQKSVGKSVDVVLLGVFEEDNLSVKSLFVSNADKAKLKSYLTKKKFKAGPGEALLTCGIQGVSDCSLIVGLGKRGSFTSECARKLASSVYKRAKQEKWEKVRIDFGNISSRQNADYAQGLSEGFYLTDYVFDEYKSKKAKASTLKEVQVVYKGRAVAKSLTKALEHASIISEGVNLARSLGNEPANKLYPDSYAKRIEKMARQAKLKCKVFDEKKLTSLKMGGILGVGMGSVRKPRLVIVEHKPSRVKNKKPIVLVGKGITFDTGGISIKPSKAMDEMKFDMCGSAAVIGTMKAVGDLKLPLHVIGMTPLAENMPGGQAQRPGDIIKCYNGKTVEVLNTDAEGRLVLADALAYAKNYKPECIVDLATLTGACAYVLDYVASGVMTNNQKLLKRLMKSSKDSGERLWEFPLWPEYDEFIKGTYADIQNMSRRAAGIQTSACFLKHFSDHAPWAHLDIAGTAWTTAPRHYNPVGGTGVGVRLLIEFLKSYL